MTAWTSQVGQFYHGPSGVAVDTAYTDKATFLADNPGAVLIDFSGIAPVAGSALWADTADLTMAVVDIFGGPFTLRVYDGAYWALPQVPPIPPPNTTPGAAPFASVGPSSATINASKESVHTITLVVPAGAVGFNLASLDQFFTTIPRKVEIFDGATLLHTETYAAVPPVPNVNSFTSFIGYARGTSTPPSSDNLILEDGSNFLLEDGTSLLLLE